MSAESGQPGAGQDAGQDAGTGTGPKGTGQSGTNHGLVLAGFALIVTCVLAITHTATKQRIDSNQIAHRQQILTEVMPSHRVDHPLDQYKVTIRDKNTGLDRTCYIAKVNGTATGVIITATATDGYAGDINLLVGILKDGTISGVRVTSHSETPGLGDAIELHRSEWIKSFDAKSLSTPDESRWTVKKHNGEFDQFTGATITPRAVINEVKQTLLFFTSVQQQLFNHE